MSNSAACSESRAQQRWPATASKGSPCARALIRCRNDCDRPAGDSLELQVDMRGTWVRASGFGPWHHARASEASRSRSDPQQAQALRLSGHASTAPADRPQASLSPLLCRFTTLLCPPASPMPPTGSACGWRREPCKRASAVKEERGGTEGEGRAEGERRGGVGAHGCGDQWKRAKWGECRRNSEKGFDRNKKDWERGSEGHRGA
eukprot:3295343-Rhodomonas_salina.1